ncbi:MAG: hypothetical protein WCA95_15690 [Opitutaceae bacterium]
MSRFQIEGDLFVMSVPLNHIYVSSHSCASLRAKGTVCEHVSQKRTQYLVASIPVCVAVVCKLIGHAPDSANKFTLNGVRLPDRWHVLPPKFVKRWQRRSFPKDIVENAHVDPSNVGMNRPNPNFS